MSALQPTTAPTMSRMKPVTLNKNDRRVVDAVAGLILRATPEGFAWALRADASGALTFYVGDYPRMSPAEACIRAAALRGQLAVELQQS